MSLSYFEILETQRIRHPVLAYYNLQKENSDNSLYFRCPHCNTSTRLNRENLHFDFVFDIFKEELFIIARMICDTPGCHKHTIIQEIEYSNQFYKYNTKDEIVFLPSDDLYSMVNKSDTRVLYPVDDEDEEYLNDLNLYEKYLEKNIFINLKNAEIAHHNKLDAAAMLYYRRILENMVDEKINEYKIEFKDANGGIEKNPTFRKKLKELETKGVIIFPEELNDIKDKFYSFISENVHNYADDECALFYDIIKTTIKQIIYKIKENLDLKAMNETLKDAYKGYKKKV